MASPSSNLDVLVNLAHQLQAFFDAKLRASKSVPDYIKNHVFEVVTIYPRLKTPEEVALIPFRRGRSASAAAAPPLYNTEWVVDKRRLREDIHTFKRAFAALPAQASASSSAPTLAVPEPTLARPESTPAVLPVVLAPRPLVGSFPDSPASTAPAPPPPRTTSSPTERSYTHESSSTRPTTANSMAQPAPFALSNEQLTLIATAMATAMANAQSHLQSRQPSPTSGTREVQTAAEAFKPRDIGYFEPDAEQEAMETKENKAIYHNVWTFTTRLRVKASTPESAQALRQNLDACLLGKAERWYTQELNNLSRSGLRNNPNGINAWCEALEARFREAPGISLTKLESLRYTTRDARNRRDPEDYCQEIMVHGRNAGTATTDHAQVLMAYQHMDGALRMSLPLVNEQTTMASFIKHLTVQKFNWFDVYAPKFDGKSADKAAVERKGNYNSKFPSRGSGPAFPSSQQGYPSGNRFSYGKDSYGRDYRGGQGFQSSRYPDKSNEKQDASKPIKQEYAKERPFDEPSRVPAFQKGKDKLPPFNRRPRKPYQRGYLTEASHNQETQGSPYRYKSYDENSYQHHEDVQQDEDEDDGKQDDKDVPDGYYMDNAEDHGENTRDDSVEAHFSQGITTKYHCKKCGKDFTSNNLLHRHLRGICSLSTPRKITSSPLPGLPVVMKAASASPSVQQPVPVRIARDNSTSIPVQTIVRSTVAEASTKNGYGFRGWRYATAEANIGSLTSPASSICLDTGYTMSLIDRKFLLQMLPNAKVKTMASPMEVRGIGPSSHNASQYVLVDIYLRGNNGRIAHLTKELHLVDELKANLLMGIDILAPEGIDVQLSRQTATIASCADVEIPISIQTRSSKVRKTVFTKTQMVIPPRTRKALPIQGPKGKPMELPADRDLMFEPGIRQKVSVFAHIVDHTISEVFVQNDSDVAITLPKNTRIGEVTEYEADGCFVVTSSEADLAAKPAKSVRNTREKTTTGGWIKRSFRHVLTAALALHTGIGQGVKDDCSQLETKLTNGITVYGDHVSTPALTSTVSAYPDLWIDNGNTARVPESEYMNIPLIENWQDVYKPGQARVYPVGQKDRDVIDKAFDKLHDQGRMEWTSESTPFTYPCFVVWKALPDGERKGRVVVNIKALNKITMPDAYPVPAQSDILSAISGSAYITTVDACSFFYHWLVNPAHRHRLTVSLHRGQETFNVAVMGYRNSPAYVQRMIDKILRPFRSFARAYVNDIVIFSNTLEEHIEHLNLVFQCLENFNICLSPAKSYVGYPSVALLGQRVDALGLATAEDKLAAITRLAFPRTLRSLERYLGLTGYLRQYIPYYAAIVRPLHQRKTELNRRLRSECIVGNARKKAAGRVSLSTPTPKEFAAFHQLQQLFSSPTILTHYDPKRQLYIDMDSSKEGGHGAYAYHTSDKMKVPKEGNAKVKRGEVMVNPPPKQKTIQPILFLSRELTDVEMKYWPTEMEIAGLVWVVRKLRHIIETALIPVIIYTDHSSTCQIVRQSSLNTVSVEKSNLKLIRSSEYL